MQSLAEQPLFDRLLQLRVETGEVHLSQPTAGVAGKRFLCMAFQLDGLGLQLSGQAAIAAMLLEYLRFYSDAEWRAEGVRVEHECGHFAQGHHGDGPHAILCEWSMP